MHNIGTVPTFKMHNVGTPVFSDFIQFEFGLYDKNHGTRAEGRGAHI